jgi:hypothetical protein
MVNYDRGPGDVGLKPTWKENRCLLGQSAFALPSCAGIDRTPFVAARLPRAACCFC